MVYVDAAVDDSAPRRQNSGSMSHPATLLMAL
jgi:hypothetical protein